MGRWVAGTVTRTSGAETLTGVDSRSYHYLAVNAPSAFPASGTLTCDAGVFTAPTYASGGSGTGTTGTTSGSASLSFGAGGATVSGSVSVTASGSTGSASLNGTASTVTSTAITGAYLSGGAGSAVQIGDAGGGAYLVAASYAANYTPFCSQPFSSPNGMALWIVKPDAAKGTDVWIDGAVPTEVNGRTWLVKRVSPSDLGPVSDRAKPIEYWTLRIPETPYWLHMRFSGSARSIEQYPAEHAYLLDLFHQLVRSVKLDPITPVDPTSMPPVVQYQPQPQRKSSQ
jgi:hypothetical protein